MFERDVLSQAEISVKDVDRVGKGLPLATDLSHDLDHPTDDHSSLLPIKMRLVAKVTIEIFTLYKLLIFSLHISKRIMLEVGVDLIDLCLKECNFLFRCFLC